MVREGATIAIMDLEMNFCLDKVISFNPERVRFDVVSKKPIIISLLSPMIL